MEIVLSISTTTVVSTSMLLLSFAFECQSGDLKLIPKDHNRSIYKIIDHMMDSGCNVPLLSLLLCKCNHFSSIADDPWARSLDYRIICCTNIRIAPFDDYIWLLPIKLHHNQSPDVFIVKCILPLSTSSNHIKLLLLPVLGRYLNISKWGM